MNKLSTLEEEIFLDALGLAASERSAFVHERCAHDATLAGRVMALLRGHDENSAYLENSPLSGATGSSGATSAIALYSDHVPGDRIGSCQLIERIGAGGCGVVYLAEQQEPVRRHVALKVIKLGMDTREFIARFEAERQALALMDHANIARVFDAGATPAGRPYFTMELVRGLPITRYADEHRLGTPARLELFVAVCHAIQHAHQKGVIHRDLKPSNILVATIDGHPIPKIIDFGIAKALHGPLTDKTVSTQLHAFVGTPAYTSPEQVERGDLDVDTRSDIYSLGVLLYELLTGQQPFDREAFERASLDETRRLIREVEPPRPSKQVASLAAGVRPILAVNHGMEPAKLSLLLQADLDWIVMRCLEKDRARRYETASALAADIQRHLDNEPVVARPPSRTYRMRKFVRRHRPGVIAAAAVAFSLLAGLVVSGVSLQREKAARDRAVAAERAEGILRRQAEQTQKNEARRANRAVITLANERLAQGRTAEGLAYLASAARRDPLNPTIAPRLASVLTSHNFLLSDGEVARHSAPVLALEYSDDGSNLIAVWEDGTLGVVDSASGQVRKEKFSGTPGYGYSRMSTRRFLLVYTSDGTIRAVDRGTGKIAHEIHFEYDAMGCRAIDESSDLFTTKLTSNTMMTADAATGRMIGAPVAYDAFLGAGQKWIAWSADGTREPTKRIRLRSTGDETREITIELPIEVAHGPLATSPDGRRLATAQREGDAYFLRLWSLPDGQPVGMPQRLERATSAFYSPDGKYVVCWGNGLEVFDAETTARIARMPSAGPFVDDNRHVFSPDGKSLATWGNADTVDLWDLATGIPRVAPLRHGGSVSDVAFSRDGTVLLTKSDGLARVWNTATGELLAEPTLQLRGIPAVALSPDGSQLVVGTTAGTVHRFRLGRSAVNPLLLARAGRLPAPFLPGTPTTLWWMTETHAQVMDVASGKIIGPAVAFPEPIRSARLRDDGRVAVVQTNSGQWRVWWRGENEIRAIPIAGGSDEMATVAFSRPEQNLVLISWPGTMRVWSLVTGQAVGPAIITTANATFSRYASFSADGRRVLVGSIQGRARVWEVATGEERVDFGQQPTNILFATFSPDGAWIASGNRKGATRLWRAEDGQPVGPPLAHPGLWGEAVFSPDSRLMATFGASGLLRVQDVSSGGTIVGSIETDGTLRSVRFSPDNTRLVTATNEGTVQVWDVQSGLPVTGSLPHGGVRVPLAEFSPDGKFIRTETTLGGNFYLWPVPPPLPAGEATPGWLIELATICAGKVVNEEGQLDDAADQLGAIPELRRKIAESPESAPYGEWGRWFFETHAQRSIAPGFTIAPAAAETLRSR